MLTLDKETHADNKPWDCLSYASWQISLGVLFCFGVGFFLFFKKFFQWTLRMILFSCQCGRISVTSIWDESVDQLWLFWLLCFSKLSCYLATNVVFILIITQVKLFMLLNVYLATSDGWFGDSASYIIFSLLLINKHVCFCFVPSQLGVAFNNAILSWYYHQQNP